jgi:hypothetical protein
MRVLIRLLLWILIAALPLQGGAVAFMSCDSGMAPSGAGTTPTYSAEHHSGNATAAAHEEHCAQSGTDHVSAPHGKCSQCASCCIGAAAPPTVPSVLMPAAFTTFAGSAVEPAMTAYIPATLERPPRRLS